MDLLPRAASIATMKEILPTWPPIPTIVREMDIAAGIPSLNGLDGFQCVSVVFRYVGEVIGQSYLPLRHGQVPIAQLEAQINLLAARIHHIKSVSIIGKYYTSHGKYYMSNSNSCTSGQYPIDEYKASVIVCTHDRTEDLNRCLRSLLPLLDSGHEIIVVDSCPSDERTKTLISQQFPQITYVLEPCPGTGIARSCGVRAAKQEFVAFTDDDAEVDPLWLSKLLRNFDDPTVGLVTGLALPMELETPAQVWFEATNTFSRGFERCTFDLNNIDPLAAGLLGATVNSAFRRSVFDSVGYFDNALGPGTPARASDDHEMFYRILAAGYRAVYDPSALVWHHHRRAWPALKSTLYNYSVSVFAWWTVALVVRNEWGLLRLGLGWFLKHHIGQIRDVILRRPGAVPPDLAYAELRGALMGPFSYFKSQRTMLELLRRLHPPANEVPLAQKAGVV